MRWPGVRIQRTLPADQPPLPWLGTDDPGPEHLTTQLTGRRSRSGSVRLVRFGDSWAGPLPAHLPDPGVWSANLAVAMSEALRGARSMAQLSLLLSESAKTQLAAQSQLTLQATGRHRSRTPPVLQSVHLQRTGPDVVEAVALFADPADPVSALAFRLESLADRWLCTALLSCFGRRSPAARTKIINRPA